MHLKSSGGMLVTAQSGLALSVLFLKHLIYNVCFYISLKTVLKVTYELPSQCIV